jgi:hypothetical protein
MVHSALCVFHANARRFTYHLRCRGERIRTADPRVPNAVRYQLRYTPSDQSIMRVASNRQGGMC